MSTSEPDREAPEVLVTEHGPVLVITINRPRQRNAMTRSAGQLIAAAVERLDSDPGLSVGVLTGAGGTFCAGMDLKRFAAGEAASLPVLGFGGLVGRPPRKPLIAAVEGHAVAGGFELVLACDLVVAGRSAVFGLPEVRRGLVARGGALFRLPQRIPMAQAMEYILTGDTFDAARAEELGLVNRVVDAGSALDGALELAQHIAANAPLALMVSKQVVNESGDWPGSESFERQAPLTDPVFASEDAHEGAVAFAEKRRPRWTGR